MTLTFETDIDLHDKNRFNKFKAEDLKVGSIIIGATDEGWSIYQLRECGFKDGYVFEDLLYAWSNLCGYHSTIDELYDELEETFNEFYGWKFTLLQEGETLTLTCG